VSTELTDGVVWLRPLTMSDINEWMAGEDEEQIRWFEFPGSASRRNVIEAIERWTQSWNTSGAVRDWAVCDVATGQILGGVEIRDLGGEECNLSYVVFPQARRRGTATRASRLALRYAVSSMGSRVAILKILEGNEASLGVARKLGAMASGTEPSERGGTFLVFRRDLSASPGRSGL
jgi:RimJ/RimL family protein N-acetyltransferase